MSENRGYINVTTLYQGAHSDNQIIKPGLYLVGDPRLFGLEDYLVKIQGKAQYVASPAGLNIASAGPDADQPGAIKAEKGFVGKAIRLKETYRGKPSGDMLLVPGVYRVDDLPGGASLAQYLVEKQNKAYWVDEGATAGETHDPYGRPLLPGQHSPDDIARLKLPPEAPGSMASVATEKVFAAYELPDELHVPTVGAPLTRADVPEDAPTLEQATPLKPEPFMPEPGAGVEQIDEAAKEQAEKVRKADPVDGMTREQLIAELALYGMDENSITGTGKEGSVVKADLVKALREAKG